MEIEWRTVQFFLDEEEFIIAEVAVDAMNSRKTRCSCLKFKKTARCKHAKFVQEKISDSGGVFNLRIPAGVDDEAAMDALNDTDLFRELVLKYGKIEIL
jgi:hypothetical protein